MPQQHESNREEEELARLREEVRVLRDAIDEFREQFTWAVRNGRVIYQASATPLETLATPASEARQMTHTEKRPWDVFSTATAFQNDKGWPTKDGPPRHDVAVREFTFVEDDEQGACFQHSHSKCNVLVVGANDGSLPTLRFPADAWFDIPEQLKHELMDPDERPLWDAFIIAIELQNKEGWPTTDGKKRHDLVVSEFMYMGADHRGQLFKHRHTKATAALASPPDERPPRLEFYKGYGF